MIVDELFLIVFMTGARRAMFTKAGSDIFFKINAKCINVDVAF